MLPVALDVTPSLAVHFQVSSQDALKHTPKNSLKKIPIAQDGTFPASLTVAPK